MYKKIAFLALISLPLSAVEESKKPQDPSEQGSFFEEVAEGFYVKKVVLKNSQSVFFAWRKSRVVNSIGPGLSMQR